MLGPWPLVVVEELLGLAAAWWTWTRFGLADRAPARRVLRTGRLTIVGDGAMIAFVRHGQTEQNRDGRLQGRIDVALSATWDSTRPPRSGASSRTNRSRASSRARSSAARQTAAAIAVPLGLPVEIDDRLVELDYGEWDGTGARRDRAEPWAAWRADADVRATRRRAPDGRHCTGRRRSATTAKRDDTVVAVSHVSPIKAAVCCALGVDERATWRMQLAVASVSRVGRRPDGSVYLASFNERA